MPLYQVQRNKMSKYRIGSAYDVHRLEKGNGFVIGGEYITCDFKTIAHSDGDVVYHALSEAIFGSLALGDLGKFFPPSDPSFKDMNSARILEFAKAKLEEKGYKISNVDVSIILERPKLKDHIDDMRKNVARVLDIDLDDVSIKAGTNEKLDSLGESRGVGAFASVLIYRL